MQKAKEQGISFFQYYLHKCVLASNQIENFKYRITPDNDVIVHDHIGASAPIMKPNKTFGCSYIPYPEDFEVFAKTVQKEIARIRQSDALFPDENPDSVIHYSAIPWLNFTALTHARMFKRKDSVPKISFGKVISKNGKKTMPIAVYLHLGLADGLHINRFITIFQGLLNS